MGFDRSLTCYVDLSYSSITQLPWWLGSAPRRESASGHHGQRPAPAHPRERPRGEHAHLMTSAGRQSCPGSPACTPPCQDCSNRAILALELTYRQPMVRRGGCGRGLTAKKKSEFQIRARRRATRKQAHEVAAHGFHIDCPDSIACLELH